MMGWEFMLDRHAKNMAAYQREIQRNADLCAQQRADWENHVRNHSFDDPVVIDGTCRVIDDEPKLLEAK